MTDLDRLEQCLADLEREAVAWRATCADVTARLARLEPVVAAVAEVLSQGETYGPRAVGPLAVRRLGAAVAAAGLGNGRASA
jgi:hypothetical protein